MEARTLETGHCEGGGGGRLRDGPMRMRRHRTRKGLNKMKFEW